MNNGLSAALKCASVSESGVAFRGCPFVGKVAVRDRLANMQADYEYAIVWNRRLLMPLGVWPVKEGDSGCQIISRKIRLFVSVCVVSMYLMPQCFYFVWGKPNRDAVMGVVAPMALEFMAIFKFFVLVSNTDEIRYCLDCIRDDWANVKLETDRETMMKTARFARHMTIFTAVFAYLGSFSYTCILPPLLAGSENSRAPSNTTKRPLSDPASYIFFDVQSSPLYEITRVAQFFGSAYMCILNCGGYSFAGTLVAHACGQLKIIGSKLEDLLDGYREEYPSVKERIAATIEHHLQVIRYSERINSSFQVSLLVDQIGAVFTICFVGYAILMVTVARCCVFFSRQKITGPGCSTRLSVALDHDIYKKRLNRKLNNFCHNEKN